MVAIACIVGAFDRLIDTWLSLATSSSTGATAFGTNSSASRPRTMGIDMRRIHWARNDGCRPGLQVAHAPASRGSAAASCADDSLASFTSWLGPRPAPVLASLRSSLAVASRVPSQLHKAGL